MNLSRQHVVEITATTHTCMPFCTHFSALREPSDDKISHPRVFIISCMSLCLMPCCITIFLTAILQSLMRSTSTFCSLHSVVAVLGKTLWGRLAVPLFTSMKCFTEHCTLLVFMQEFPKTWQSQSQMLAAKLFYVIKGSVTAHWQNDTSFTAISPERIMNWCAWPGPLFQIAENIYTHSYCQYTL
jgi:hypothetical protein